MIFGKGNERTRLSIAGIVVAAVFFVAINALSNGMLRGASVDFTQDSLFTLSDGTRSVLAEIDEPITIRVFYSPRLAEVVPAYGPYAARVRELLTRYVGLSGGKIELEIVNPEPFTDDEDRAVALGLTGVPITAEGDVAYFGLAGSNSTDDEEVIPFFHIERERFLEYDLTRLISELASPKKKVVGVLSSLPIMGVPGNPMAGPGSGVPPWLIVDQIRQRFDVRDLDLDATKIDPDVDVLMLVHPKALSERTLYAIDQFVLGGGAMIAFVDPHAEADRPGSPMLAMTGETSSDLSRLLAAWNVSVVAGKVAGDKEAAVRVSMGGRFGGPPQIVDYLAWLSLDDRHINADDVVTADLSRLVMATPGAIRKTAEDGAMLTPLVSTGQQSMLIDTSRIRFVPDPAALWADFQPSGESLVLAARLSGTVASAFPDGPPPADAKGNQAKDETKDAGKAEPPADAAPPLKTSKRSINVILVADTDMLREQFWVQVRDFFGQQVAMRTSGNADFVLNALENLSGGGALISLRSRGDSARPFNLVRTIQQDAEARYRKREQELEAKLSETEKKLSDLRTGEAGDGALILTAEQEQAIEDFRAEMVTIRKDLRDVQLALRQDIDRLDAWLKFINIGLMPILVGLAAVVLGILRRGRRRRAVRMAD